MNNQNFLHWLPVEENKNSTTFEGSLHSKMSLFRLFKDIISFLGRER